MDILKENAMHSRSLSREVSDLVVAAPSRVATLGILVVFGGLASIGFGIKGEEIIGLPFALRILFGITGGVSMACGIVMTVIGDAFARHTR